VTFGKACLSRFSDFGSITHTIFKNKLLRSGFGVVAGSFT